MRTQTAAEGQPWRSLNEAIPGSFGPESALHFPGSALCLGASGTKKPSQKPEASELPWSLLSSPPQKEGRQTKGSIPREAESGF